MDYRRRGANRTAKEEKKKDRQKKLSSLKKYKLTLPELKLLRDEIIEVPLYMEMQRSALEKRVSSLEKEMNNINKALDTTLNPTYDAAQSEYQKALARPRDYDGIIGSIFFHEEKKRSQELYHKRLEEVKNYFYSLHEKYYQERCKRLDPIKKQIEREKGLAATWWEQAAFPLLTRMVSYRGQNKTLGEELLGTGLNQEESRYALALEVLDLFIKEEKKRDEVRALKYKAASSEREARQLANAVKKQLSYQLKVLKECPYCGQTLNMESAHADHIYPISKGGNSSWENMVYVCKDCNMKKRDNTLNQFIKLAGYDRDIIESRLDSLKKEY